MINAYVQPLCKSVRDSDFGVRHFSICNRGGPLRAPRENVPSEQWSPESMKNKINDLSSLIYSHKLYYIFFVVLNLSINNINVTGAPHCALTSKLNHEHFY
jgi:hypothetical protein